MSHISFNRGKKRKSMNNDVVFETPSGSSKVILLSPSLLLLEIPPDTNTSLPVWEAIRSQQLNIAWTVNPYSISVHLTPATSKQRRTANSSKSESTFIVAQTSEASSSIQQSQLTIHSINQQYAPPQNTSCVLLTFPQNGIKSPPRKIPPGTTPDTSFLIPLPVIITQSQSAVRPTKKGGLAAVQTKTGALTDLQARVQLSLHTRSSTSVEICDDFLLRVCPAGKKCKMHHTPLPFHWQLRCAITRKWIDFSPPSQILLERIYCNVNQDVVSIRDGKTLQTLHFDSKEFEESSRYDRVRRLTNSNSVVKNPYFPSKLKMYWCNEFTWEEYDQDVSAWLLKNMSKKEPKCSFTIDSREYKVDFTDMVQTNVTTGFKRDVRCRPVYYSPKSMQPYLQTGVQTDPTEPDGHPPGANFSVDPLEEFSSWYPPVWVLNSELDCRLVDVPSSTQAYRRVQDLFYESLSEAEVDIVSIQQVQNLLHWDKYQRQRTFMQKHHTKSKEPLERHLFHGTTKEASEGICRNNFDPRLAGVNGMSYGLGSYFATTASFSRTYAAQTGPDKVHHMFLAKVLVGKVSIGRALYRRPPPLNPKMRQQYHFYDACVDSIENPTMFVVFDNCQCYPYYLIKYKDLPQEIEI